MRCDDVLKQEISARLDAFERAPLDLDVSPRQAAVTLTILEVGPGADIPGLVDTPGWSTEPALLLTRRAEHLRHHPGQWALPGGRVDPGETLVAAALRELHEEVGLQLSEGSVLGRLDDFVTRSGFSMTPIVVWAGTDVMTQANPDEVASVHRIPISEFMRSDAPYLTPTDTSEHPVLRMPIGDDWIAAPTAALLYQFREVCMSGRATRVAHFEQPEFAWR